VASESPMLMPSEDQQHPHGDPFVGQTLGGKYVLERLIGRGGMGHVYLATVLDPEAQKMPREVVVKMIAPSLAQQPQAMARFDREAKRLDELRNSNIVEMYDHGREGSRAYIVMEYVDGELLSDYVGRKGKLALADFVPIAAQILKGFGYAHSRDLMIRDIKPANVMLCERKGRANFVKVIDFGLAKLLEGEENITKQHFIGTSGYLSPEQIKGLELDLRVDVYALGVLFYQMLSGRMPYEAENDTTLLYKHVHDPPTPLAEVLPDDHEVPEELIRLIHDCLAKEPDGRPNDANEIVERLIDCVPMSMFKLPPASAAAAKQASVSALSTAALAAPPGQTAAYLRREGGTAVSPTRETPLEPSASASTVAANQPPSTGGKRILMVVGVVLGLAAGAYALVQGSGSDSPKDSAALEPSVSAAKEEAESKAEPADALEKGTIEITSKPAAELTIDGFPAGNTPYANPLSVGRHTLELTAEGYAPWTRELEIKAGENPTIDVKLEPLTPAEPEGEASPEAREGAAKSDRRSRPRPRPEPQASKPKAESSKPKAEPTEPRPTEPKPTEPKPKPKSEPAPPEPSKSEKKKKNPFLPTSKGDADGPFLPTEK
jgi:eukaryotic-like serine/threonine-protein kinase